MDDKLVKRDQFAIYWIPKAEIHVELENGTRLSGVIREVSEDGILLHQPHRGAVIWVRKDQVIMASNMPIWI
ncbi:hypothetical protein LCGC14_1335290 [marine sediment metagenome]|uniref:PilZ domain-containing protein n=1 Tax=marine sediment metagenome TaxID=412755 RepID=A0A0F9KFA1_9ZZZZ